MFRSCSSSTGDVALVATFGSTVDTYSSSACGWLWKNLEEFHIFLRGLVDSDPEVVASLTHVTTLVVNNGSGMHSIGFAGFPAPCAAYPTITGRKWPRSSSFSTVACSGGDWLRLLVTMHFALCSFACRPFWVEEGVAALVVVSGSSLRFPGFAGLDAPLLRSR